MRYIVDIIKIIFLKFIMFINQKKQSDDCEDINNILIVRLDEIGDVTLTSPLLRNIRYNYPMAFITLIVKKEVYNLIELCPYVDEVKYYDRVKGKLSLFRSYFRIKKYIQDNDIKNYDLALVPRYDLDNGYFASLLAYLAHAKKRIGYSACNSYEKTKLNLMFDEFYTSTLPLDEVVKHEVERNLDVVRYLGGRVENTYLELWCSNTDCKRAKKLLEYSNRNYKRIAVFMTAGSKKREWNINCFRELIEQILREYNCQFILMGYGRDAECKASYIKEKTKNKNVFDLTGKATLRETYAMLKFCNIYLGGDTGPMHMAVAAGLSGVVLSCHPITGDLNHYNSPARFGPWNNSRMIVLRPQPIAGCERGCVSDEAHCINNISVEDVYKKIEAYL